jgi:hypothetical protein
MYISQPIVFGRACPLFRTGMSAGTQALCSLVYGPDLQSPAMVMRLPQDYFATRAEAAKKAVYTTFGRIVEILKDSAPQPNL